MSFLPVVHRELAIAARRRATYRQRFVGAALVALVIIAAAVWMPLSQSSGAGLFRALSALAFLLCLIEGVRATADSIARERREGTLGLLLVTGLRGHDLVLGKLAAAAMQSLGVVLAVLPMFALPLLIGGVTVGESWRVMIGLVLTLSVALAAGMAGSAWTSSGLASNGLAFLFLFTISIPPVVASVLSGGSVPGLAWLSGPFGLLAEAFEGPFRLNPWHYGCALVVSLLLTGALLGAAILMLQRRPRLEPVAGGDARWLRWFRAAPGQSAAWGGASATVEPAVWLAERTLPGRRVLWVLIALGALFSFFVGMLAGSAAPALIFGCALFFALLVKFWLAAVAPQSLSESRRGGALELILCTPVTPDQLVRGQVDALIGYFFTPALAISTGFPIATVLGSGLTENFAAISATTNFIWVGMVWMILFVLDLHALAYAGLWFGLTTPRVERAIAKTAFAVLLLPLLTLVIPVCGLIGMVGWPIFWIYWCGARLRNRFRDEAAIPLGLAPSEGGWFPWSKS